MQVVVSLPHFHHLHRGVHVGQISEVLLQERRTVGQEKSVRQAATMYGLADSRSKLMEPLLRASPEGFREALQALGVDEAEFMVAIESPAGRRASSVDVPRVLPFQTTLSFFGSHGGTW